MDCGLEAGVWGQLKPEKTPKPGLTQGRGVGEAVEGGRWRQDESRILSLGCPSPLTFQWWIGQGEEPCQARGLQWKWCGAGD